jgi:hypothetical protein
MPAARLVRVKHTARGHPLDVSFSDQVSPEGTWDLSKETWLLRSRSLNLIFHSCWRGKRLLQHLTGRTSTTRSKTSLRLPNGELSRLADLQRREDLKRNVADPPERLFKAFRELILGKCKATKRLQMGEISRRIPLAHSSASSHRSCWMWPRELPKRNWKARNGCCWACAPIRPSS